MSDTIKSKQVLSVIGVVALMLIAGCFSPPPPPGSQNETEVPEPEAYMEDGGDIEYPTVLEDNQNALENESQGFHTRYTVEITDPRLDESVTFQEQYRINTRTENRRYRSNFTGSQHSIYHNSVLYYEQSNSSVNVQQTSEVPASELIQISDAAGNSTLVSVGMNSASYVLSNVTRTNGSEVSTYQSTDTVRNYALGDLIPEGMDYSYDNPQSTDEQIDSTLTMQKNGLMTEYTFDYTAQIYVDGQPQDYSFTVTYTVVESGPNLEVIQPQWAGGQSPSQNTTESNNETEA